MFDDCNTLTELNKKRATLMQTSNISVIELNAAYNARRKTLSAKKASYKRLQVHEAVIPPVSLVSSIPFAGQLDDDTLATTIMHTKEGFVTG